MYALKFVSMALNMLIIAVVLGYLMLSPYTKVEESFNIQAIHDILNYGIATKEQVIQNYDHFQFPGAVPRTFVGSIALAGVVKIFDPLYRILGFEFVNDGTQIGLQIIVRGLLGLINVYTLIFLGDSLTRITSKRDRRGSVILSCWFKVLLLTQFHLLYYATRTLPNFIALPLVSVGLSRLIEGNIIGFVYLGFCGVVFRMEIGVFSICIVLVSSFIFKQHSSLLSMFFLSFGVALGLLLSLLVDSYFWNAFTVPEVFSFIFNVIKGKSSEWGTEPFQAYFTYHLLKIFRPPLILILCIPGLLHDPLKSNNDINVKKSGSIDHPARNSLRILFVSSLLFIIIMSLQPHKEWRFIIYTIPIFSLIAANGIITVAEKEKGIFKIIFYMFITAFFAFGLLSSMFMAYVSSFNYPGGDALTSANGFIASNCDTGSRLHLDVASCISGVTRFGEFHNNSITYDKTEDAQQLARRWKSFDFLITETKPQKLEEQWDLLKTTEKYRSLNLRSIINVAQHSMADKKHFFMLSLNLFTKIYTEGLEALKILDTLIVKEDYLFFYKKKTTLIRCG